MSVIEYVPPLARYWLTWQTACHEFLLSAMVTLQLLRPHFPPVLPKELASMMPSSFVQVVIRFRSRLEKVFDESYIDALEAEHRTLRDRYHQDPLLKDMLDSMKDIIAYHDAWVSLRSQFPKLYEFSSGLATIYPGTTRGQSDFSILGWEKDAYRYALMDFSLEGVMHSKQFKALQAIDKE
jgi:hypothetical protein